MGAKISGLAFKMGCSDWDWRNLVVVDWSDTVDEDSLEASLKSSMLTVSIKVGDVVLFEMQEMYILNVQINLKPLKFSDVQSRITAELTVMAG